MRNLFKKSLTLCLVAILAFSCFAGIVSAENSFTATIAVENQTITPGTTSVDVVLDITSSQIGINEALIEVSSDIGTIGSKAELVSSTGAASIQMPEGSTNYGSFYLSAENDISGETTVLGSVTAAKIKVTFTVAEDKAVGTYPINIKVDGVRAASSDEDVISFSYATANVTVEEAAPEHVHNEVWTSNEDGTHTSSCNAEGCDGSFVSATEDCTYNEWIDDETDPANKIAHTCSVCGYTESKNKISGIAKYNVVLDEKIGLVVKVLQSAMAAYDHYELVFEYTVYDTEYAPDEKTKIFTTATMSTEVGDQEAGFDPYRFTELAFVDMDFDITYHVRCYDAENNLIDVSKDYTRNITSLAKSYISSNTANPDSMTLYQTNQTVFLMDLLNYGDATQTYFANLFQDSKLAEKLAVDENGDGMGDNRIIADMADYQQYASTDTKDTLTLNPINIISRAEGYTSSNVASAKGLAIGATNIIRYQFLADESAIVRFTYVDSLNRTSVINVPVAEMDIEGGLYTYYYDKVCIGDIHIPVKTEVILNVEGVDKVIMTNDYNFEKLINDFKDGANSDFVVKMARLGHSAFAFMSGEY